MTVPAFEPTTSVWLQEHGRPSIERSRPASRGIPSQWLCDLWESAGREGRVARWSRLPDEIGDLASERGFTEADRRFLCARGFDDGTPAAAAAAVFALGRVAEDLPEQVREVAGCLVLLLQHAHPRVRLAATEAVWQARAVRVLPLVREALCREPDPEVRATMEHVLRVVR